MRLPQTFFTGGDTRSWVCYQDSHGYLWHFELLNGALSQILTKITWNLETKSYNFPSFGKYPKLWYTGNWDRKSTLYQSAMANKTKLKQLECLLSENSPPPPPPPPPHTHTHTHTHSPILLIHIGSQGKTRQSQNHNIIKKNCQKFDFYNFAKKYLPHTFWSCLIKCVNIKSDHASIVEVTEQTWFCQQTGVQTVRRMDRRTDPLMTWYQYSPLSTSLKRGV